MVELTIFPSSILYDGQIFSQQNCFSILSPSAAKAVCTKSNDDVVVLSLRSAHSNDGPQKFVAWRPLDVTPRGYELQQDGLFKHLVSRAKQKLVNNGDEEEEMTVLLRMIDTLRQIDRNTTEKANLIFVSQTFLDSLELQPGDLLNVKICCTDVEEHSVVQAELIPRSPADFELLQDQTAHVEVNDETSILMRSVLTLCICSDVVVETAVSYIYRTTHPRLSRAGSQSHQSHSQITNMSRSFPFWFSKD